jgi:hypothetical protein
MRLDPADLRAMVADNVRILAAANPVCSALLTSVLVRQKQDARPPPDVATCTCAGMTADRIRARRFRHTRRAA